MFALAAVPLIVAAGAAVDYARVVTGHAVLQQAVDAAVLAGAAAPTGSRNAVAGKTLSAAIGQLNLTGVTPSWATNADGSFTGVATGAQPLVLSSLIGMRSMNIRATATGIATASAVPSTKKVCALVLDPAATQAFLVNANVTINAPNCEIDVASTGSNAAVFNAGDTFNMDRICLKGVSTLQNGGPVPVLRTGCTPASNPFATTLPTVSVGSCTVSNQTYTGANTLTPGVYCGSFNFNATGSLNLQPGLYILKGANWNLNTGWSLTGTGVTFYFVDQNSYIQINGGATMNTSAPSSGTYANILMFEPNGLPTSAYTINGSSGHQLDGLIYQPSRNITFNQQSNVNTENFTLVVNQLTLDTLTWNIAPAPLSITPVGGGSTSTTVRLIN
jgi:Flp pilus assembly protein TadG